MKRLWAWLKHILIATPEESEWMSRFDDEMRRIGQ